MCRRCSRIASVGHGEACPFCEVKQLRREIDDWKRWLVGREQIIANGQRALAAADDEWWAGKVRDG